VRDPVGAAARFFLRNWIALCYDHVLQLPRRCAVVDLALKLNVLAVFAVFLFVAAILLGAF